MDSVGHAVTQAGSSYLRHKSHFTASGTSLPGRGAMEMFSQGQALAQAPQPVHSSSRMNTSPRGSRPMAPVGQSIMHTGFSQCWHEFGSKRLLGDSALSTCATILSPRRTSLETPCTSAQAQAQWPQRTQLS